MAVLYPARVRQVCVPKRHTHQIFGFGRILAFLAKNILRQMCLMSADTWRARAGYESSTPGKSLIDISSLQKTRKFLRDFT